MKRIAKHALAAVIMVLSVATTVVAGPAAYAVSEAISKSDYATALRLARPLADRGDAEAQFWLGVLYHDGEGVPQDYETAVKWYRKAADQGFASAQHNLGFMYWFEEGVPKNYVTAHMWLNLAAARGNVGSAEERDKVRRKNDPSTDRGSAGSWRASGSRNSCVMLPSQPRPD
jgi:uncharacterized protein